MLVNKSKPMMLVAAAVFSAGLLWAGPGSAMSHEDSAMDEGAMSYDDGMMKEESSYWTALGRHQPYC